MNESLLIWGLAGAVCAIVPFAYLFSFQRREAQERSRLKEAKNLGIHAPRGQFPYIDPEVCIGCGGCVRACPEKDVLGLIGGLAAVINGARCLGIGQCAVVCPVGGIEIGVGDFKGRADVPAMNEVGETNVPGLFIAGELGGLALIRNAIRQGRDTVERITTELATIPNESASDALDLVIVGAGPAGLSAALTAKEAGLSFLLLEQQENLGGTIYQYPRRKLTHTQPVEVPLHGPLTRGEYTKEELLEIFQGLVEEHRLPLRFGQRVVGITRSTELFEVETVSTTLRSRRVLLALGRRGTPRKLGVPGEDLPKVTYQVRDAGEYRGKKILCVGGGDSAIEAAMGLARQPGNEVTLSYRKEKIFRIKAKNRERLEGLVRKKRLRLVLSSNVVRIEKDRVHLATGDGEISIENDYVFVMVGGLPPFPFLRQVGIRFRDEMEMPLVPPPLARPQERSERVPSVFSRASLR